MAKVKDEGVWFVLNEGLSEVFLRGVPNVGDKVVIFYTGEESSGSEVKVQRLVNPNQTSEYFDINLNNVNTLLI